MSFIPGQRWISDSESDQGLGTVITVENRQVTILFTATGESRQYAMADAPLTRVKFNVNDVIPSHDGWKLQVTDIEEQQGLYTYHGIRQDNGEQASLKEVMIDHFIQFNKPQDRLMNGQIDRLDWYRLRRNSIYHQFEQQQSALSGLVGGRVSLIPHQLYIAEEVGKRFAPRVLLADEVGLGKTIEAGLILHQQLVSGRAQRALIVVPDALVNQWLVEMLRRFNLRFSIFDADRCAQADDGQNPFSDEQLVLVSLSFICEHADYYEDLIDEQWDLLVVDEAHHLAWSEQAPSLEYQCIEQLAQAIPGVLLLTATPEQLGHESHFARLKLLDADRFYDYQTFVEQEQKFNQIADVANTLLSDNKVSNQQLELLNQLLADETSHINQVNSNDGAQAQQARAALVEQLLDRHGTGRILFRNSRHTITGFPERKLIATELELPEQYQSLISATCQQNNDQLISQSTKLANVFSPEFLHQLANANSDWTDLDPRVDYLIELLQSLKHEKLLVICAHAQTAIDLEQALRVKQGIRAAIFHEHMSIFERDRAAAYFAQEEESAQVLLCSEIGSEGRNFQFAHHLVLFDLPYNPDLLEQRIGRLDRIGQKQTVNIHVPYFSQSPSELLFGWYHQGLQAFEQTCVTGRAIFEQFEAELTQRVINQTFDDSESFYQQVNQQHLALKQTLEQGRDKLLELHSCGREKATELVQQISAQDEAIELPQYMFNLFDVFGLQQDDKGDNAVVLQPSEHMLCESFPYLPQDGTTITFNRDTALACEDYQLLTWDHPMVREAMDLVLSDEIGNATIGLLKNPALPAGTFFLECLFTVEASAPSKLQLGRFLPVTPIRLLIDAKGNNLADKVSEAVLEKQLSPVKKQLASQLVKALKAQIPSLVTHAEHHAKEQMPAIQHKAKQSMEQHLSQELQRLTALAQINPNVRQEEIDFISQQQADLCHYIDNAQLKFEAIRLIVVTQ